MMALHQTILDDLTWRDMTQAARSRIAALSQEEWTHHSPVDPGVTLIELFAYLLEQRIYWLDQIPDTLLGAIVALHGEDVTPAIAATTLFELNAPDMTQVIPAGQTYWRRGRDGDLGFTTTEDIRLLDIDRIEVESAFGSEVTQPGSDQTSRTRWPFRTLPLFATDDAPNEVQFTLWLHQAPIPGRPIAFLLDQNTSDKIPSSWSVDAVPDVNAPAALRWSYSAPAGRQILPTATLNDGTQGLRRAGTVRIDMPSDWATVGPPENGLLPYRFWLSTEASSFSTPPELTRIVPNVVTTAHQVEIEPTWAYLQPQTDAWLRLPGQKLALPDLTRAPDAPILPDYPGPLEDSLRLELRERIDGWQPWTRVQDFSHSGPTDRHFVVDRRLKTVAFGDGLTGRLPVLSGGAGPKVRLKYLGGGGDAGNVGANLDWEADSAGLVAHNPIPARGGAEPESPENAADRLAALLQQRERAVTAVDYEALSLNTPGVAIARARAFPGHHPLFPCVTVPGAVSVFILPEVPRHDGWIESNLAVNAPVPDPGMLSEVRQRLDERRLVTTEVFVSAPVYRRVKVRATIAGDPVNRRQREDDLRRRLGGYLDPLIGGPDGNGWPFGEPVRPSELSSLLQEQIGDVASVERVAIALDDEGSFEDCQDVPILPHQLIILAQFSIHWNAAPMARGGLR